MADMQRLPVHHGGIGGAGAVGKSGQPGLDGSPSSHRRRCRVGEPVSLGGSREQLPLPSIAITPSSDEDTPRSVCSTPSSSPRQKRSLIRRWLKGNDRKRRSCANRHQSGQLNSHEDDSLHPPLTTHFLSPFIREERADGDRLSTASNSSRSSPACSPILRKRSRSPTPQSPEGDAMVEKSTEHAADRSPPTAGHTLQPPRSGSGGKNSKKSQSWYNVLSPTYKQRNEDFRKLFKQLPDSERLIVDYSCALQRDILLQGRLYLSENWICFYSNIFRWETLLMVRLKEICSMTKEKTARLIPNAIQLCTESEKHFFTSFGARDRTYMMMFRLWQNALLEKPLCPKELWHFVHQCYGNELGLTSDDEDYVPPDDDFNTMGCCPPPWCRYNEENEANDSSSKSSAEARPEPSPQLPRKPLPHGGVRKQRGRLTPPPTDLPPAEEYSNCLTDGDLLAVPLPSAKGEESVAPSPSLDFNDNEDLPTELSDSSETHDEVGEVQAFQEDLPGKLYINEIYKLSVDKMHGLLFTESQFMRDFLELRRFSDVVYRPWKKDDETGNQTREMMYTIALSNPLAPKSATVTETQTLYKASQESECYIIDAEVIAHDVPYHDYFYTLNRYVLTRVAKNKCRLRASTELRYRKQPWGLVKGFIERNFWSGLDEYFRHLELELSKMEAAMTEPPRNSPKSRVARTAICRRRKRTLSHLRGQHLEEAPLSPVSTPEHEEAIHRIRHVQGSTQTRHIPEEVPGGLALYSVSRLLLVVSLVLVILVFLNMMLFYKLWMLERTTQSLATWPGLRPHERYRCTCCPEEHHSLYCALLHQECSSLTFIQCWCCVSKYRLPQTQAEWAQLLESQQRYHDDELQKWREILRSSVLLLDQMKKSLLNLQKGIILRDYSSEPEESAGSYH
ncbi:protein Aster-B-like isoform X4 [Brienomyrus brachyistius]|uniref:protein Aster-B-like isoform X4 n=1 Tax=Brienomyrus brachyistius TaxID=42636 RepID=UPI0020B33371|nr:protein Aster-B-like isoform X4 [Brienomyrus brachyistius]